MTVSDWYSFFQIASVVTLFLSFAFGAGVVLTGLTVNKESREETDRIKREAARTKAESDVKIANATKGAGLANQAAGEANERAAKLEVRASEAELQAKQAETRIAEAQRAAAEAQRAAEEVRARSEALRKENLVLQADLLRLRKESESRRLTGQQRQQLAKILASAPIPIVVLSRVLDTKEPTSRTTSRLHYGRPGGAFSGPRIG